MLSVLYFLLMFKLFQLNKGTSSSSTAAPQVGMKEGPQAPSTAGILTTPSGAASMTATGVTASLSTFPADAASSVKPLSTLDPTKCEAVKRAQELAARMGFRQDPEFAPLINLFPGQAPPDVSALQKPAKAPVLRLDAYGREVDEHGNPVNISKPSNLSTLKVGSLRSSFTLICIDMFLLLI